MHPALNILSIPLLRYYDPPPDSQDEPGGVYDMDIPYRVLNL